MLVHSSPVLKSWGFLYIFVVHIGELRFRPPFILIWGFFYQSNKVHLLIIKGSNITTIDIYMYDKVSKVS